MEDKIVATKINVSVELNQQIMEAYGGYVDTIDVIMNSIMDAVERHKHIVRLISSEPVREELNFAQRKEVKKNIPTENNTCEFSEYEKSVILGALNTYLEINDLPRFLKSSTENLIQRIKRDLKY